MPRRTWTEADYDKAGKVKLQLRLDKDLAQHLVEVARISGQSRQSIIENFLRSDMAKTIPKAELVQPLRTAEDYGLSDTRKKKTAKKKRAK